MWNTWPGPARRPAPHDDQPTLYLIAFTDHTIVSALGYWMAERIADPVNRLTRATRRIARGDLLVKPHAQRLDLLLLIVDGALQHCHPGSEGRCAGR